MNIKITVNNHGRLNSATREQIHSSLGGIIGKQLAAMALPEIQREIQRHIPRHVPAQSPPTRFIRIADLCAKSKPANSPLRLVSGFPPLTPNIRNHFQSKKNL